MAVNLAPTVSNVLCIISEEQSMHLKYLNLIKGDYFSWKVTDLRVYKIIEKQVQNSLMGLLCRFFRFK